MYNVRQATSADTSYCLSLLKNFSKFYGLEKYAFYSDDIEDMTIKMSTIINHHVVYVSEHINDDTGEIGPLVGVIGGMLTPHFYNKNLTILTEMFWWVDEKHRKSRAGHDLIKTFIAAGKAHANLISFCLLEHSPIKASSIEVFGFKPIEKTFIMEI